MNDNIERAAFILSHCPSCFHNFLQPICEMTCSSKQSNFLKVQTIEQDNDSGKKSFYSIELNYAQIFFCIKLLFKLGQKPYVTNIDFSITYDYLNGTFQSCSKVSNFA